MRAGHLEPDCFKFPHIERLLLRQWLLLAQFFVFYCLLLLVVLADIGLVLAALHGLKVSGVLRVLPDTHVKRGPLVFFESDLVVDV